MSWTEKHAELKTAFIDWRCDPEREGSMKQWAEDHNFSYESVRQWNADPSIRAIIERRLGEYNTSPERMQSIMEAMWKKAQNGDTKAAQLYLAYAERIAPTRALPPAEGEVEGLTDDELAAELAEASQAMSTSNA